jgi:EAL domain-containing protein (putative c-di-GMP-specific phosphodiesterase class I)
MSGFMEKCEKLSENHSNLGSGYTSLSNLCDYPIDIVKIDRDILLKADNTKKVKPCLQVL